MYCQTRTSSQHRRRVLYKQSVHFPCHKTYRCHHFLSVPRSGGASRGGWVEAHSGLSSRVNQPKDLSQSAVHLVSPCRKVIARVSQIQREHARCKVQADSRAGRNDGCGCTDRSALQLSEEGSHVLRHSSAACRAQDGGFRACVIVNKRRLANEHRCRRF